MTKPLEWVSHLARQPTDKTALVTETGELSYGELLNRMSVVRTLLIQKGLQPRQHLLLAISDERQMLCLLLGALSAGLIVMLPDTDLPAAAANELVQRFKPDLITLDQTLAERWRLPGNTWSIEAEPAPQQGALLRRLLGRSRAATAGLFSQLDAITEHVTPVSIDAKQTALIFFTSGSSGLPKAVEISHAALSIHLDTLKRQHGYEPGSRLLNQLPLSHADGLVQGPLVAIYAGSTLYCPLAFTPENVPRFLDLIYAESITHLVAVPTMLALMLRLGARQYDSFTSAAFRHVISTAGHLEESMWRRFEDQFKVQVCNSYGLTETVAGGIFSGPGDATRRVGALGRPVDCETRIIGLGGGDLAQGETGELLLRGDNLMNGYYLDSESTAAVLRDGWLYTGDLAWSDADGFLHFAGRAKSVIVCGGLNIQPEEVDDVLSRHPSVHSVATLGLPHPEWEAIVVAAVVPVAGTDPTEAELLNHCRLFLPPYKLPRRLVFLNTLPYGLSGKVRMEVLREICLANYAVIDLESADAEQLMTLVRQTFRSHRGDLSLSSGPDNTQGWDSLAHMEFVSAIEKHFGVTLNERDITAITHLGAAIDILANVKARG